MDSAQPLDERVVQNKQYGQHVCGHPDCIEREPFLSIQALSSHTSNVHGNKQSGKRKKTDSTVRNRYPNSFKSECIQLVHKIKQHIPDETICLTAVSSYKNVSFHTLRGWRKSEQDILSRVQVLEWQNKKTLGRMNAWTLPLNDLEQRLTTKLQNKLDEENIVYNGKQIIQLAKDLCEKLCKTNPTTYSVVQKNVKFSRKWLAKYYSRHDVPRDVYRNKKMKTAYAVTEITEHVI